MSKLRIVAATLAAVVALGALAGLAVVFLGLFNTSARKGHWAVTGWVLHETFQNAVELRAPPPSAVPSDLLDPELIELGARHFDGACRTCHAPPGGTVSATVASMVPEPPPITEAVADWRPEEMHWIVHQGVKMSGMPAWPDAARPDEVWAVVAFLAAVQRGMEAADYAAMTAPAAEGGCASCHGPSGTVRAPRLDILDPAYIQASLAAYRSGMRPSGIMSHVISQVDPAQDAQLADALSMLPGPKAQTAADIDAAGGGQLARTGTALVPACLACHGNANRNPLVPQLYGQGQDYLEQQLLLWRAGQRGGGDRAVLMHEAASALTDGQIEALAAYFSAADPPG